MRDEVFRLVGLQILLFRNSSRSCNAEGAGYLLEVAINFYLLSRQQREVAI